ncbi:MAG TPA: DUF3536 domain-containing protein [bacterium]|nr:DUF3536 domain-containing protein [bacterium]
MTDRRVCIHAHFYQPPRENPWLEEVEVQYSAYPHHDWNERVCAECYAPNAASRILGGDRKILDIVNNYSRISFNFGPTLLTWMARHEPEVYGAILDADRQSRELFSGHGSALAQVYNHVIMPLADERDKRTQVIWGIRDFEHRFKRRPEGMWLAETAVDIPTLEALAEQGIAFTILAQHQAGRVRRKGEDAWHDLNGEPLDTKVPYACPLPSGRSMALFFYDGRIAHDIAFGNLLDDGGRFANRLMQALDDRDGPQLVHIATDGETYGHHHRFGDMALAYCLHHIDADESLELTVYGEHLERFPPEHEVEIVEKTSWSCAHGVERWRSDCGCRAGGDSEWVQGWRAPLRGAFDWLKEGLDRIYEEKIETFSPDPWAARDSYIDAILDRSTEAVDAFLTRNCPGARSPDDVRQVLRLLEMQRHSMLMYTSCAWFFDEISGIETVESLRCAARAMQLAQDSAGIDLESSFESLLAKAPSNVSAFGDGSRVYEILVKPSVVNLLRVGAHYAVSSLFEEYHDTTRIYSYEAERIFHHLTEMGRQRLLVGRARLRSSIVREEEIVTFAVLHLGDHNLYGGVRPSGSDDAYESMRQEIQDVFRREMSARWCSRWTSTSAPTAIPSGTSSRTSRGRSSPRCLAPQ